MAYYTLSSEELAKEIIKDYADDKEGLVSMANAYLDGDDYDFLDEVDGRVDMEYLAEEVANEILDSQ